MSAYGIQEDIQKLLDSACKFFDEATQLADRDPTQACEKLYKVVENCIKALAIKYDLEEYHKAKQEGTWWSRLLGKAAHKLAERLNVEDIVRAWQTAFDLHVNGFHEEMYGPEEVKKAIPTVKKLLDLTSKLVKSHQHESREITKLLD